MLEFKKVAAAPVDSILAILGEKGENIDALLKDEATNEPKAEEKLLLKQLKKLKKKFKSQNL